MLADKMEHYKKEKKMLRNTPASYKKEYPWLKEVDSLALANVQMHLESAFHKFFREPSAGFPRFKSKKSSRKSYTTNVVNGNIFLEGKYLKLPKMTAVRMKLHRPISEKWKLKSVTVSREPSGKYFASLLFCCENQTAEKRPAEKFIGIDFAMQGMCVFSTGKRAEYPMFYQNTEKKLAREQRKLSRCQKGSQNYKKQKKRVALCHEKIRNQRKDFQHKLSTSLAESYDAVCVEDLNLKGMAGGLHLGKGVHDNGYGLFLSMLEYKLEERGKYLIKVDRYFASSKICSIWPTRRSKNAVTRKAGIISPPNFSVSPVRNRTIGQSFLILYFSNRLVSLSKADGQHAFWAFSASLRHFYSSERAPEPDAHSVLHPSAFFVSLHTIPYAKPDSRNE